MNSNIHVSNHFDKLAKIYDVYKKRNPIYYQTLIKGISQHIIEKNKVILDIGCGTGTMLSILKPKKGVGIDISKKMIVEAKRKNKNSANLSFFQYDIEKKLYKGKFDYIIFADVIEHVVNKDNAIKHIAQSMNKNSTLILSMANPLWEPILMLLEYIGAKMPEGPHYRISESELYDLAAKNNLSVISKKSYLPTTSLPGLNKLGLIFVYAFAKKNSQY